jgi:hypothetical protein
MGVARLERMKADGVMRKGLTLLPQHSRRPQSPARFFLLVMRTRHENRIDYYLRRDLPLAD